MIRRLSIHTWSLCEGVAEFSDYELEE